ncbi:hypothetical protein FRC0534_00662 [Corynebacterium diphtheriae]|uniref:hypothetical protein n=1 Tax=Corynebacterium diphtheriae TaxID=1717 RepID=UPI000D741666|nr:hypothetical protein [Corynebacterium diphtheriae]AWR15449.1 hypothetical protein B11Q_00747 [Corynebacterium diphtheriae]CAB1004928.1 hypothetical protein FRC0534_00662 [Corynebacterium diphtheriae]
MMPYYIFMFFVAVFLWRKFRNLTDFLIRFVPLGIICAILYVVIATPFVLFGEVLHKREDGKNWREQQIEQTGIDPCAEQPAQGDDVLPGVSQQSLEDANTLSWEERDQRLKDSYDLMIKCKHGE